MTVTLAERIAELAQIDAVLFLQENDGPLDPATTEWDSVAWFEHSAVQLGLTEEQAHEWFNVYDDLLVAETARLCKISPSRRPRTVRGG